MHRCAPAPRTPYPPLHRQRRALASSVLLAALTLALTLALWASTSGVAHAQGPETTTGRAPGGRLSDPAVRAADLAAPAVVRISTVYDSHITLNVCGATVTLPHSAAGYTEGVLGSGAFISAHGDILTADHLIQVDHDILDQQLFADPAVQADIARALNASPCYGFGPLIAPADIGNGFLQTSGVEYHTTFTSPRTYVWRDTAYSGALPTPAGDNADLLKALMSAPHVPATTLTSSDFAHDDLAALHVDERDTPSIQLGVSANVEALDSLTVIGFPGNGDANNAPTNLLTPSFNLASVSAIKTNTDGAELIQVGGNIEHGDSGGPALDDAGHIVGVVSFGGPDTQGMTAFLRSSDSARSLISAAHVDMRPGALELAWERAFRDYSATYAGHWHRSSQEFTALLKQYPQFHGAAPYASWARARARVEPLPQARPTVAPLALIALGGLALLDLAFVALTLFRAAREPLTRRERAIRRVQPGESDDSCDDTLPPQREDPTLHDMRERQLTHSSNSLN